MRADLRATGLAFAMFATACGTKAPSGSPGSGPPPSGPVRLTASDVTMIWPMPVDEAQRDTMITASSAGRYGEVLPDKLYELPVLDQRDFAITDPHADRARLRVVAARFEPCRGSFAPPQDPSCLNQIRLVLQVLRVGGGAATGSQIMGANDGAVLVFYKLSRPELLAFARELAALRDQYGGGESPALGVHPVLGREGLGSAYARALQAKILEHVGVERLTRVTFFMRTAAREPLWEFGAFDVVDGKLLKKAIATIDTKRQTLEGAGPRKVVEPATSARDNPGVLLTLMGPSREASVEERAAYAALLRIQNPTKHTPETMACAECHASQRMQAAAEKLLGLRSSDFAADDFKSTVRSATDGKIDNENFHAAGYLGTNLAVSTRTANDTSAVVAAMSSLLGG